MPHQDGDSFLTKCHLGWSEISGVAERDVFTILHDLGWRYPAPVEVRRNV
jgi:hypothetical protein